MTVHKLADHKQSDWQKAVAQFVTLYNSVDEDIWLLARLAYSVKQAAQYGDGTLDAFRQEVVDAGSRKCSKSYIYDLARTAQFFPEKSIQVENSLDFTFYKIASAKAAANDLLPTDAQNWIATAAQNPTWNVVDFQNHLQRELSQTPGGNTSSTGPTSQQFSFSPAISEKLAKIKKVKSLDTDQQAVVALITEAANGTTRISAQIADDIEKDFEKVQTHLLGASDEEVIRYALQQTARSLAKSAWADLTDIKLLAKGEPVLLQKKSDDSYHVAVRDGSQVIVGNIYLDWKLFLRYAEMPA